MQARRTLTPGQKDVKKFLECYGEQIGFDHYVLDEQRHERGIAVEIIVEESGWSPL